MATGYHKFPLSQYAQSLELSARARYLLKIDAMKEDPYLLKKSDLDECLKGLPSANYTDIVNYLVNYQLKKLPDGKGDKSEEIIASIQQLFKWMGFGNGN